MGPRFREFCSCCYHFCLNLPEKFTNPWAHFLAHAVHISCNSSFRFPKLIGEVGAEMGLSETELKRAVPFFCDHAEPQVRGSTGAMFGAVLGFPLYMDWNSREEEGEWEIEITRNSRSITSLKLTRIE